MEFAGKTALVTGAAGGIGQAIVAALRAKDAVVVGTDMATDEDFARSFGVNVEAPFRLTRAVAVDHGGDGIRCNAVAPGWIDTDLNLDFIASQPAPVGFSEAIKKIHPLGRTGTPEEVAEMICWLASDAARFVTGQVMTIDGGRMAKLSLP